MAEADSREGAQPPPIGVPVDRTVASERVALIGDWQALRKSFSAMLSTEERGADWLTRFMQGAIQIRELAARDADAALYMMLQTATHDLDHYSASHAMFCAVVADLCTAYAESPAEEAQAIRHAALTMNLGMLVMQDSMAQQSGELSDAQKQRIEEHPLKSIELLKAAGVEEPLWLEIVRRHHRPIDEGEAAEPLAPAQRLAQLLQRIDVFTAKLSRRRTRPGSTATVAARDACLDESGLPDATGATMLRVLGLYPPGSFVRIKSGETGVVVWRGERAHTPVVAGVRRADGGTIVQPTLFDTGDPAHAVQRSLSAAEVSMRLDHERIAGARTWAF